MSLREPSDRPGGGQKGHKGETLRQTAEPDRIVTHEAAACRHCGAAFSLREATGGVRRRVFDLPERLIEVTEHRGLVYACACRGKPTRAAFPEGVTGPAQYGDRLGRRRLSPCPAIDSRGSNGRGARRSHRRRWPLRGQGRNGRGGACAGRRADRRPHPRRACAASTRRACASAARRNGCIRRPPKPSPFTAPAPSVARCRKASKAASSSMTASSPIAIWTALRGPRPCALQRSPSARTQSPHSARQ